jgi:hypothetical protein
MIKSHSIEARGHGLFAGFGATRKLFAAFDGAKIPQVTIEDARRFFEKRR